MYQHPKTLHWSVYMDRVASIIESAAYMQGKAYAVASGPVSILAGDRVNTAPGHRMWEVPDLEG